MLLAILYHPDSPNSDNALVQFQDGTTQRISLLLTRAGQHSSVFGLGKVLGNKFCRKRNLIMFHSQYFRASILPLVAVGFCLVSVGIAHGGMKCFVNPDNSCTFCAGTINGDCCTSYSCPDGSGATCGPCSSARVPPSKSRRLAHGSKERVVDEASILARLLEKDTEIAAAVRSLR